MGAAAVTDQKPKATFAGFTLPSATSESLRVRAPSGANYPGRLAG